MTMRDDPNHPPSEELFAYRDGELLPEKRAVIEAHVMACSTCRSFIDQVSSLEAELRQSADRAPAGYLERLHERVRARIAGAGVAGAAAKDAVTEDVPIGRELRGRAGAWRERDQRREEGRVKEVPGMPWAAVLSTASAAAAVLVVVAILIKQGMYQQTITPKSPVAVRAPGEAPPESIAPSVGSKSDLGMAERDAASGSDAPLQRQDGKLMAAKDEAGARENLGLAKKAETAPSSDAAAPESQTRQVREEELRAADGRFQEKPEGRSEARLKRSANESPQAAAGESNAPSGDYQELLGRFGLPPIWDPTVNPEDLERAEPELRTFYLSGAAGSDSARVRLYLAEAARLRYAPGDASLYEEIERHYRRAIELSGSDTVTARTAEERLRSLER